MSHLAKTESAYLTLATAQLHGQTLRQIVFIRIATNVKYALSKNVTVGDIVGEIGKGLESAA